MRVFAASCTSIMQSEGGRGLGSSGQQHGSSKQQEEEEEEAAAEGNYKDSTSKTGFISGEFIVVPGPVAQVRQSRW